MPKIKKIEKERKTVRILEDQKKLKANCKKLIEKEEQLPGQTETF